LLAHPHLFVPYFSSDHRHIGAPLHRALGNLVSHLIHSSLCSVDREQSSSTPEAVNEMWPGDAELGEIPRVPMMWGETPQPLPLDASPEEEEALRTMQPPEQQDVLTPVCQEAGYNLEPVSRDGWNFFQWKFEKSYWVAEKAGKVIEFKIQSGSRGSVPRGQVAISYLRSKMYELGKVRCWVDGRMKDAVEVEGSWSKGASIAQSVSWFSPWTNCFSRTKDSE